MGNIISKALEKRAEREEQESRIVSFTPGPWEIRHEHNVFAQNGRRGIASAGGYSDNQAVERTRNENIANAHLIASAPELLEMLRRLEETQPISATTWEAVRALIAKAEGRE